MNRIVKNNLKGVFFMLLNAIAMAVLYATVKFLTKDLNSNLVVFLYKFLVMLAMVPVVIYRGGFKTKVFHLHFIRGIFSVVGSLFAFFALKHIDLTDVTALGYLEQVLLMTIGIVFFAERASITKVFAIISALTGAFLIIYKTIIRLDENNNIIIADHWPINDLNEYHILVLLSVLVWAVNRVLVKILGRTERAEVQLFYVSFFSVIVAFPWAFFHVVDASLFGMRIKFPSEMMNFDQLGLQQKHIWYLLLLVFCYWAHSFCTFKALQCADLSIVVPFEYTRLIFAALIGAFVFNEVHTLSVYLGCTLIILSGVFLVVAEHNWNKRRKQIASELEAINEP